MGKNGGNFLRVGENGQIILIFMGILTWGEQEGKWG
jgi:hypothetical protein